MPSSGKSDGGTDLGAAALTTPRRIRAILSRGALLPRFLLWAAACTATWFAWAWLPFGVVPVAVLAGTLAAHAVWVGRRSATRPGLPRPLDGHVAAAWVVGTLTLALYVGYRADWLVQAALGTALLLKAVARPARAPEPPTA